jgi:hypothetical protein
MPFLSARTFSLIFCFDLRLRFSLALSPLINDICAPQWSFVQELQSLFLVTLAITAPSISYQPKEGALCHRESSFVSTAAWPLLSCISGAGHRPGFQSHG